MEKAGLSGRQGLQKEVAGSEHGPGVIGVIDDPVVLLQTAAREIGVLHRRLVLAVTHLEMEMLRKCDPRF